MNKRQKEVIESALKDEQAILDSLQKNYTTALADIKRNIRELQANPLTQSKAYQLEFQKQLEKQISGIIDNLQGRNFTSIADYLNNTYRNGFLGSMYDMQGQGVPLIIPIDERQVLQAVQKTGDDFKLSNKLGVSTKKLKEQVHQELVRGLASELTYAQIARNISDYGQANMHRSMNIARTEGHRVQNTARMDSMQAAKARGADIVKQWDCTLDGATRPEHAELDGQVRELDEDFTVGSYSAPCPGSFGDPYMDCNCRCCMLQRARWAVSKETSYQKWNNETGGFIECTGFEDFKEKYLNSAEQLQISHNNGIINNKINYAKADDVFDYFEPRGDITPQAIVDILEKSDIGKETLKMLETKGVKPKLIYSRQLHTNRGHQRGNTISIFIDNIPNAKVAAQTIIHETTHLYYNIGQCQWAEAVCFAKEKMFLTGRPLTIQEKRYIVKLAKDNYPEFHWKKGGYGYGKRN